MTYYISQGRVETPIRIGGQLCYISVANLLKYLCQKISKYNAFEQSYCKKIKGCNFSAPLCSNDHNYDGLPEKPAFIKLIVFLRLE